MKKKDHVFSPRQRRLRHFLLGTAVAVLLVISGIFSCLLFYEKPEITPQTLPASEPAQETTVSVSVEPSVPSEPAEATLPPSEAPSETAAEISPLQSLQDSMSLNEKICQLFMAAPEALSSSSPITAEEDVFAAQLSEYPIGGIVLFQQNILTPHQCRSMISAFQESSRIPLLIGVDEEGGTVSRVGSNSAMEVRVFPPMSQIGASGDLQQAYEVGNVLGEQLGALGFNLDFAPVADILTNKENTVIGSRAFSSDPSAAADMTASAVQGFQEQEFICCLKHFPGHGHTVQDSHIGMAVTERTADQLRQAEFLPFSAGIQAGAPMVMVGHISAPQVTGDSTPATLSKTIVTDLLRNELGFQGVIVTDAMNMGAITESYPGGKAAVLALQAGCDLILMPENLPQAIEAVQQAVSDGDLTVQRIDESVTRILELKYKYGILNP